MAQRFSIDGVVYTFGHPEHMSLRDWMLLEADTADIPWQLSGAEVVRLHEMFQGLIGKGKEFEHHPESIKMLAVQVWLAMVKKQRDLGDFAFLSFAAALDGNFNTFKLLPNTDDRAPAGKAPAAPKKAAKAKQSRPASGQGGARAAAKAAAAPRR